MVFKRRTIDNQNRVRKNKEDYECTRFFQKMNSKMHLIFPSDLLENIVINTSNSVRTNKKNLKSIGGIRDFHSAALRHKSCKICGLRLPKL